MRILHLSDIHIDKGDPMEELRIRFEKMIRFLEDNMPIDFVIITGDHILYSSPKENFCIFVEFIEKLKNRLNIDAKHLLLCSGNHEWTLKNNDPKIICEKQELDVNDGKYYIKAFEYLKKQSWLYSDLCELYEDSEIVIVVAEAFCSKGIFIRNCKKLGEIIKEKFIKDMRLHILAQHAPECYYCHYCEHKINLPKNTIVLCGHKIFSHERRFVYNDRGAHVFSGVSDGFVEKHPIYGLYDANRVGIDIKYFQYGESDWFFLE